MKYVFDTCSIRALQHFYPAIFGSIWQKIDELVEHEEMISTKEVFNELKRQDISKELQEWVKNKKSIFKKPTAEETEFVSEILRTQNFAGLIGKKQQLKGQPVADPFVVACAKQYNATVVTEEGWDHDKDELEPKPKAAKIPNVCQHFGIRCIDLETFMNEQGWRF
ncbi:MAG: DUF4411 family protein [Neisseriaceae bacterium]|nr:DUF4411 family protein [Neisseriaceae bacterium]